MAKSAKDGSFGLRGWLGVAIGLTAALGVVGAIAAFGWLLGLVLPHNSGPTKPTVAPATNDYAYWYCWDAGAPRPHHIGSPVHGDHVCTEDELRQGTPAP